MKISFQRYLVLFLTSAFILLLTSCKKDSDLFLDTVLEQDDEISVEEQSNSIEEAAEEILEEVAEEIVLDENSELRTTSFLTTNDAHVESGKGYDQNIIRLEEGNRTSYLMFDLRAIDSIAGTIKKVTLQFTVESDDGYGPISIFTGKTSAWAEESISSTTAPEVDVEVGTITGEYNLGSTVTIPLLENNINPNISTLIISQQNGNDFAFASKEHATKSGPKLIIEYLAPIDASEINAAENGIETEAEETSNDTNNEAPVASATSNVTSGEAPLVVNFRGDQSTDDSGIVSYSWNFLDGSTSTEANPTHTFENPGIYQIEFTVTDEEGATDTDVDTITVTEAGSGGGNTGGNNGNYPSHAVFASSYGFQAGNATEAFEDAMNSNNSYIVIDKQSSDWVINPTRFFDTNNKTIIFEAGVVLRAKSGAFSNQTDNLLELIRPKNLIIEGYNATFQMVKSEYNSGEFRHALAIEGGENITIRGLTIKDSGGDGIYIGKSNSRTYSSDITIEDVISSNNRRQGMSIITAQNVWVRNSQFLGTNGANPESGVDLEPDESYERLININFENCKFANNNSHGFMISTPKLNSSSSPISVTVKNSTFSNNGLDNSDGSKAELLLDQGALNNPVKGSVTFENTTFENSNNAALFSRMGANSYTASFKNCTAKNIAKQRGGGVIVLEGASFTNTLGGFSFDNFQMEYTANVPFMLIRAPNTSGFIVKDITGTFTIKEPNDNPLEYTGGYNKANNQNVNINYTHL